MSDFTACVLTPNGRGAVATIAIRGELSWADRYFTAASGRPVGELAIDQIAFGNWGEQPAEEVVLLKTGENQAELHCHGGMAAVERILAHLSASGGKIVSQTDWLNSAAGDVRAECLQALSQATTRRTAHHLLRQMNLLPDAFQQLGRSSGRERQQRARELLQHARFGLHLLTPWKVVVCGRPNVGKSSLINALLGYTRTVVFDQPGTTRDVISAETAFDGWPVELSDTAGLRETEELLESTGIQKAREQMQEADLMVILLDASTGLKSDDLQLLQAFPEAIPVWNKIDLLSDAIPREPLPGALEVSASTTLGIKQLMDRIVHTLVPAEPPAGVPFPVTSRQVAQLEAWAAE